MTQYVIDSSIQQTEQINGYQLFSFSLASPLELELALGRTFTIEGFPETELCLFQAPQTESGTYQFLSHSHINQTLLLEAQQPMKLICHYSRPFCMPELNTPLLILAENLFMANAFALSKQRKLAKDNQQTVFLHTDDCFPFMVKPARFLMQSAPAEAIGASTLLEDWQVQNRLASDEQQPGCFHGSLPELFAYWLEDNLGDTEWNCVVFADTEIQKKCLQLSQSHDWLNLTGISV